MKFKMIKIKQPIGEFYFGKIEGTELKDLIDSKKITIKPRKTDGNEGVQRDLSVRRTNEIIKYTEDKDATFPTPIIIAIEEDAMSVEGDNKEIVTVNLNIALDSIGEIIDGQHRMTGLIKSKNINFFQVPIVFMWGITLEEKAYIFSIINSKQTKVDPSLIYDLFGEMSNRSPQKTCHEIARLMNKDKNAPYFDNLKMLGKKEAPNQSLSQGTFVKYLMKLISKNPDEDRLKLKSNKELEENENLPLRKFFIEEKDEIIYKIISNVFNGLKKNYLEKWDNTILTKTVTYCAVIKVFNELYEIGQEKKDLSTEFFEKGFANLKTVLKRDNKNLFTDFISGGSANKELSEYILNAFQEVYNK